MKFFLQGASGRMGREVAAIAAEWGHEIIPIFRDGTAPAAAGRAAIDFSSPDGAAAAARLAASRNIPLISGTTGLTAAAEDALNQAAATVPVVHAANFSLAVALLRRAAAALAAALPDEFTVEIVEMHHRHKRDAPSGTAKELGRAVSLARGMRPSAAKKEQGEDEPIPIHSLRGGDIPGEHAVHFLGEGERLVLGHSTSNRRVFAAGALRVAERAIAAAGRFPAGRYGLEHILSAEIGSACEIFAG